MKRRYPVGMWNIIAALVLIAALSLVAVSSPEVALGSRFADLYSSFAPLYALYRSYADHLFSGTSVVVPPGIAGSCDRLWFSLHGMALDLPRGMPAAAVPSLIAFRWSFIGFCASYRSILERLERGSPEQLDSILDEAGESRLFSSIFELEGDLEEALSQALGGFAEGIERWRFAVAFATRTIIDRDTFDRIDEDLQGIFYGEGRSSPPMEFPDAVNEAMASLIGLSGRSLTEYEANQARYLAECIECYFVFGVIPEG